MFANLKNLFKQVSDYPALAKLDQVRLNVPDNAEYVTLSATLVVDEQSLLMSVNNQILPVSSIADRENKPMQIMYMIHDGANLKLIRDQQELLSVPLTNITALHRFMAGGLVLHLSDGRGIALTTPGPVQTDDNTKFRTIHGVTDMTGGWIKELEPYNIHIVD